MTPSEKNILKSLVVVAWADGRFKEPETGVIDALIWAFDASEEDGEEIREFAKKKRTFEDDLQIEEMGKEDRALLLAHAALLTHADGKQTKAEKKLLDEIISSLGLGEEEAKPILASAKERARKLAGKV